MDEIVIEYIDKDGKERKFEVEDENNATLDLSRHKIVTINLETLVGYEALEELNLGSNAFSEIDLSPLAKLPNLTSLNLFKNKLETINLSELAACKKLLD
jgi:Leucine-rich repeat (LRR) protein